MFHMHRWRETKRTYTPPFHGKLTAGDDKTIRMAMLGITVVELTCRVCGDVCFRTTVGRSD